MPDPTTADMLQQLGALEARLENQRQMIDRVAADTQQAIQANAQAISRNARDVKTAHEAVETLKKPFWRRGTVLTSGFASVALVAGWLWSAYSVDSPFPMYVHRNVLLTEPAIAQTLRLASADASHKSPAYDAIGAVVSTHVEQDPDTRTRIEATARRSAVRTFNGSKTFLPQELSSVGLGCLLSLDPAFVEVIGADPGKMAALCDRPAEAQVSISIPFVESSPLYIPFAALPGDTVNLSVKVLATQQDNADVEFKRPLDAITIQLNEVEEALDLTPSPDAKEGRHSHAAPDGGPVYYYAISLSQRGYQMVGFAPPEDEQSMAIPALFTITVSATVTVEPAS